MKFSPLNKFSRMHPCKQTVRPCTKAHSDHSNLHRTWLDKILPDIWQLQPLYMVTTIPPSPVFEPQSSRHYPCSTTRPRILFKHKNKGGNATPSSGGNAIVHRRCLKITACIRIDWVYHCDVISNILARILVWIQGMIIFFFDDDNKFDCEQCLLDVCLKIFIVFAHSGERIYDYYF